MARDCTNPPNVWGTTAANAASDASSDVSGMHASAVEEVPASSSPFFSRWASQVVLHNSECVSAPEALRDSSIAYTPQLFPCSGDTAGSETIRPSGSDNVVVHETCGPARSEVNDVNDTSSRRKSKSATAVLDHGAGDATQTSWDSINSNDTASSDVVSVIGVEKDPADISNVNKKIDNSANDSSDSIVSVIVVDSGLVPPTGVSNIICSIEDVAGNEGRDISDSHTGSDEAVVAGDSPSTPPPSASSEVEMVDASAVRKRSRPSGLSDGNSSGSAPSLEKETKKEVYSGQGVMLRS